MEDLQKVENMKLQLLEANMVLLELLRKERREIRRNAKIVKFYKNVTAQEVHVVSPFFFSCHISECFFFFLPFQDKDVGSDIENSCYPMPNISRE